MSINYDIEYPKLWRKYLKLQAQVDQLEDKLLHSDRKEIEAVYRKNEELEVVIAEKDQLLKEIIPLIPDFKFALERNPAIANYDYLKAILKQSELQEQNDE